MMAGLKTPFVTGARYNILNDLIFIDFKCLKRLWRSLGDSNPCFRRERAAS